MTKNPIKMNHKLKYILLLFGLIFLYHTVWAQKNFTVLIQIPSGFNTKDMGISYDTGKESIRVQTDFKNNQLTISANFYAKYATLYIYCPNENGGGFYNNTFWIGDEPAKIIFVKPASHHQNPGKNPLENPILSNVYEVKRMGGDQFDAFIGPATKEVDDFLKKNDKKLSDHDLVITKAYLEKLKLLNHKKIEFITNNPSLYYSFWLFRTSLMYIGSGGIDSNYTGVNADSLLRAYHSIFPDSFKNTTEGAEIARFLNGRNIKKNTQAPDFTTKDIDGKTISLSNYRKKHVLLVFWASYCSPCRAEVPAIKKIRELYPPDKLEIISISADSDPKEYAAALKKYSMNWVHVYGDKELLNTYGISGVPVIYLIDDGGKVIYIREDEKKDLDKLLVLNTLLTEYLGK